MRLHPVPAFVSAPTPCPTLASNLHLKRAGDQTVSNRTRYANIAGASPLPKGMDAPALVNAKSMIDVNTAPFEEIEALPSFIREKMQSSDEFKGRVARAQNMSGARINRPDKVGAELAADESFEGEPVN